MFFLIAIFGFLRLYDSSAITVESNQQDGDPTYQALRYRSTLFLHILLALFELSALVALEIIKC